MYNSAIQEAVRLSGIKKQNMVKTVSDTYKGTTYRKGIAVLLNVNDKGHELGRIVLLVSKEKVYLFAKRLNQCQPWILVFTSCNMTQTH